jgi:hypothetical protein
MLNALMVLDQAARGPRDDKGNRIYDGIVHLDIKREWYMCPFVLAYPGLMCVRLFPSWCAATHVLVFRGADQDAATFALADFGIGMRLRVDRYRGGTEQAGTGTHMRCYTGQIKKYNMYCVH